MDISRYHQLAQQKQGQHRQFLAKLAKKPPKNLDRLVKALNDEVFSEIDCTQCANCCLDLGPLLTEADIERLSRVFRIKPGQFESQYLKTDEDGDKVFQCMPCPFLGSDQLCTVYDSRPKACREFPHLDRKKFFQINHLTIQNSLVCPAVYVFLEKLQGILKG